jgi:hypothetical protein
MELLLDTHYSISDLPNEWITPREASRWASLYLQREIDESNIIYLVQYGRIRKNTSSQKLLVSSADLKTYYADKQNSREVQWKERLGNDLNWALSFENLREKDTTKHVHRLHPYKGKFIPQLVEYFLDDHVDTFKTERFFSPGDIVLDPFSGSGTTAVQACEMGIHAIGVDVSRFNCMMADVKLNPISITALTAEVKRVLNALSAYEHENHLQKFEEELSASLTAFNNRYFPSPDFKYQLAQKLVDETNYAPEKEKEFLEHYYALVNKYHVALRQENGEGFLDKWYIQSIRQEIDFVFLQIKSIEDSSIKKVLAIILSRTIRSCRATTHSDLATLKEPQITTYYCWKHKKICKPLFSLKGWFARYAKDIISRLKIYNQLRSPHAFHTIITADSQTVDILQEVQNKKPTLAELLAKQKIRGIFTSPPYVGQIDYHEQHAYAYELFGLERKDNKEIGPLFKGQGMAAKESYVESIASVLQNARPFLTENFDIFLVANDKHNLYPRIAEKADLQIVNQFKRPVLNRTERDKSPYAEIIFHLKARI